MLWRGRDTVNTAACMGCSCCGWTTQEVAAAVGGRAPPRRVGLSLRDPWPSCLGSWLVHEVTVPGGLCASPGKLVSSCNTAGGSEPPRITGGNGWRLAAAHSSAADVVSGAEIAAGPCLLPLAVMCLPVFLWSCSLQPAHPTSVFARVQSFVL